MAKIHHTAIVDPKAELAEGVEVGAYAIIKGEVVVGPGTIVQEHTQIHGHTIIGSGCRIGPASYVGFDPQHLKYQGERTSLIVGNDVTIRELVTIHRGSATGLDHATRVGDKCYLMGASHIAHDCQVGAHVIMANAALLAGHCTVGERAFLGGGSAYHQFVRVGRLAVVAGGDALSQDVPPFAATRYQVLKGYNAVGCRRAGLSRQTIVGIRAAFFCIHASRTTPEFLRAIAADAPDIPEVREIVDFIRSSKRGIVPSDKPRRDSGDDLDEDAA